MTTLTKGLYSLVGLAATTASSFATIDAGDGRVISTLKGNDKPLDQAIMGYISAAMGFLALIAVAYGIYGGFLILTAGGDEEKVKKGRTIVIQILMGLLIIAIAYSIVNLAITFLFGGR